jgi:glutamine amidotransferase
MGNLVSNANMIKNIGYKSEISSDLSQIESAERIILPGVGHFDKATLNIKKLGLISIIKEKALVKKTPIFGICLGMQLLCKRSEEGSETGFKLVDAEVKKFSFDDALKLKIPYGLESC